MRRALSILLTALLAFAWASTAVPSYAATGYGVGDTIPDLPAVDQYGDATSLHALAGEVTVVHICAAWCGPCQEMARATPALLDEYDTTYGPGRVRFVEVLVEGASGPEPATTQALAAAWSGLSLDTVPVLHADGDSGAPILELAQFAAATGGFPTLVYLDRNLRIVSVSLGFSPAQISAEIAAAFAAGGATTAAEALTELRATLESIDLRPGARTALTISVDRAEAALAAGDRAALERAVAALQRQLRAMSPGQIDESDADALTDLSQAVLDLP